MRSFDTSHLAVVSAVGKGGGLVAARFPASLRCAGRVVRVGVGCGSARGAGAGGGVGSGAGARRSTAGGWGGGGGARRCGCAGAAAGADERGAGPGPPPLSGEGVFGDGDLLGLGGQVGPRGVLQTAGGRPGGLRELQPPVVAVAGVDRTVAAALTLGDGVPGRGGRGRRGQGQSEQSGAGQHTDHAQAPCPRSGGRTVARHRQGSVAHSRLSRVASTGGCRGGTGGSSTLCSAIPRVSWTTATRPGEFSGLFPTGMPGTSELKASPRTAQDPASHSISIGIPQ